jgi:hypothetical protein
MPGAIQIITNIPMITMKTAANITDNAAGIQPIPNKIQALAKRMCFKIFILITWDARGFLASEVKVNRQN